MFEGLNISPDDVDALARVVNAEAGLHGDEGQQAVLWTILNRVAHGGFGGRNIRGVLTAKNQFEPVMRAGYDISQLRPGDTTKIASWMSDIAAGKLRDPTQGALYFLNRDVSARRGSDFGAGLTPTYEYGPPGFRHSFYRDLKPQPRAETGGGGQQPRVEVMPDDEPIFSAPPSKVETMREDEPVFDDKGKPVSNFRLGDITGGFWESTLGVLDIPGNVTKWAIRQIDPESPYGQGADYIRRQAAKVGMTFEPGREPQTFAADIGRMTGAGTLALAPVVGAGARALSARGALAGPAGATLGGRIAAGITESAARAPGRFGLTEAGAATGAAAGGQIAESEFGPEAKLYGQLMGALAPSAVTRAGQSAIDAMIRAASLSPIVGPALKTLRGWMGTGPATRAGAHLQKSAADVPGARAELGKANIDDIRMTPAQQTGDPGLMALERTIIAESPKLSAQYQEQLRLLNDTIKKSIQATGGAPVSPEAARDYFRQLMDARLLIARGRAEQRLAALGPRATREDANRLAREELEGALSSARQQEKQIWGAVDRDLVVEASETHAAYSAAMMTTPKAQVDDIPAIAQRVLGGEKPQIGPTTNVKELHGLYSKLGEVARIARAAGEFNKARIAEDMRGAILQDLGARAGSVQGQTGESLRRALDFSKDLNDRFVRGPVGNILGSERTGTPAVAPGLTLEKSVGRAGAAAREEAEALRRATEFSGNAPAMREHIQDFLRGEFNRRVVRGGEINPTLAATYLRERDELLKLYPELKTEMEAATQAGRKLALVQKQGNPDQSAAAVFLRAEPGAEIAKVLKSPDPGKQIRFLVKLARRDSSGTAERGLKSAFLDHLIQQSTSRFTLGGLESDLMISGSAMRQALDTPKMRAAVSGLFTKDETNRLLQIATIARKMELSYFAGADAEMLKTAPSYMAQTVAAVLGARAGRALDTGTIQAPGKMAAFFQRVLNTVWKDPARKILTDAIENPELFRTLMMDLRDARKAEIAFSRLNGWLAGVAQQEAQ